MDLTASEGNAPRSQDRIQKKKKRVSPKRFLIIGSLDCKVTNYGRRLPRACHLFGFNDFRLLVLAKIVLFAPRRLPLLQQPDVPVLHRVLAILVHHTGPPTLVSADHGIILDPTAAQLVHGAHVRHLGRVRRRDSGSLLGAEAHRRQTGILGYKLQICVENGRSRRARVVMARMKMAGWMKGRRVRLAAAVQRVQRLGRYRGRGRVLGGAAAAVVTAAAHLGDHGVVIGRG